MSSRITPNWSQNLNGPSEAPRTVHTRKNTSFADWKVMLIEEMTRLNVTDMTLNRLATLHAWEGDCTPQSHAYTLWRREERATNQLGFGTGNR